MIQVDIKSEDIERAVTDAIVGSVIGEQIKLAVGKALGGYSFQKAVDDEVVRTIAVIIRNELTNNEDVKAKCKAAIAEKLTDEAVLKIVGGLLDKIMFG